MTSPVSYNCKDACSLELDLGLSVTLVATPSAGSRLVGWTGACNGKSACQVTLDGDRTTTALFRATRFLLTVTVRGKGHVSSSPAGLTCNRRCSATFDAGSRISLRAIPAAGYRFAGWAGSCGGKRRCFVTLDRNRSAIATFARRR
jgi:hypothetical protein